MRLGEVELWPVLDGQFVFAEPPGFPAKSSPDFAPHRNYITDDGLWLMDIGAFLVRTEDRLMLIDAGAGPGTMAPIRPPAFTGIDDVDPVILAYNRNKGLDGEALNRSLQMIAKTEIRHGRLADSLAVLGVSPEQITDVVLSHLHHDHIGWVSRDGQPFFPRATYRCERRDIDFFLGPHQHDEAFYKLLWGALPAKERLGPVLDRIEPWDGDAVLARGVNALFAPGHTPGHCIFILSSGETRGMILGDAVHCPLELTDPDFSLLADMDQALADRTRERIRREIEDGDIPVAAPHFPELQFGRLLPGMGKKGWTFQAW